MRELGRASQYLTLRRLSAEAEADGDHLVRLMWEDHSSLISFEAENLFYLFGSEGEIKKRRKRAKDSQSLSLSKR